MDCFARERRELSGQKSRGYYPNAYFESYRSSSSTTRSSALRHPDAYLRGSFIVYRPPDAPTDWDQLIKQTYSVWVNKKDGRKKWHLSVYPSDFALYILSSEHAQKRHISRSEQSTISALLTIFLLSVVCIPLRACIRVQGPEDVGFKQKSG